MMLNSLTTATHWHKTSVQQITRLNAADSKPSCTSWWARQISFSLLTCTNCNVHTRTRWSKKN